MLRRDGPVAMRHQRAGCRSRDVSFVRLAMHRLGIVATAVCCLAAVPTAGRGADPKPAAAEVAGWIGQLGSPQYAQREAAARSLTAAGRRALGALEEAVSGRDFETASRSVEILRGMLAAEDAELASAAERILERVATADAGAAGGLAAAALEFHHAGLAAAARERLEQQGAVFRERLVTVGEPGLDVEFNAAWRGGAGEWRQLPRLRGVVRVSVHGVPLDAEAVAALGRLSAVRRIDLFGTGAPEAALAALAARLPDVVIDVRKGGKLGVSSLVQVGTCELSAVQPGSAADKAGLRAGDVIVAADGEPVATFEALTAWLARHGAGEAVRLEVIRDGPGGAAERFERTVRLDAW